MTAITRALSAALLHFVWQGLAVAILVWLALFLLRKRSASLRYLASCAALALLVVLPAITAWLLYEHPAAAGDTVLLVSTSGAPRSTPPGGRLDWLALAQTWAVPIWSCGVLLFSLRMVWGCAQVASLRRAGEAADAQVRSAIAELANRMGVTRQVRVLLSAVSDSPSVFGWLRPVVLLPVAAMAGLTPDQLEAVLAHELAHIRRHDYLVNLLQMAAEALLFYHPAVWWISGRIRHERELCCDDLAVRASGGALSYARALTALEKMRAARPALALGSTDGPLFYRIRRLMTGGGEYGPSKLSGTIALTLGLACLGLCVNWARGQEPLRALAVTDDTSQDERGVTVHAGAALLHRTGVEYPEKPLLSGIHGTVSVDATLDNDGQVIDARVLSGPNELRKAALTSVLNWHFAPGSGNTRIVQISFQPPADKPKLEVNEKPLDSDHGVIRLTTDLAIVTKENELSAEMGRLNHEVESVRARLVALELDPGANTRRISETRGELAELEKLIEQSQLSAELEIQAPESKLHAIEGLEGLELRSYRLLSRNTRRMAGRELAGIEIRGLSSEFAADLRSRLAVHEGDTLTDASMEAAQAVVRKFDGHLESSFDREPEGAVLRIQAPGAGEGRVWSFK